MEIPPGGRPIHFGFDVSAEKIDLADLRWADPRVPEGTAAGEIAMEGQGETRLSFGGFEVASGESRVEVDGALAITGERLAFEGLDVRASPLALARVEPWLERPLPVSGTVLGTVALDGAPEQLDARGRITLRRPGPAQGPVTADFDGVLHLDERGGGFGFTDLVATIDPFDFGILGELDEEIEIDGPGRVTLRATGHTSGAIRFTADVHHRPPTCPVRRDRGGEREPPRR